MDKIVDQSDVLLERLLSGVTNKKSNVSCSERAKLEKHLQGIKKGYEERWPRLTSAEAAQRKTLLKKMLKNTAERRELRQQLGTDGEQEIVWAGGNRVMFGPDLDDDELKATLQFTYPGLVGAIEEIEEKNIRFLLDSTSHGYHKGPLRIVVIEPFLMFLDRFDLWESAQPLTNVVKTLFDWLGVEQRYRLTDTGIRTIVREFKSDGFHPDRDAFARKLEEIKRQLKR
jgi:hypothetical protein